MGDVVNLSLYKSDVAYIQYDDNISGITIYNIKIEFIENSVMLEVLDGVQMVEKDDFVNLLLAYLALERPDLLQFDE